MFKLSALLAGVALVGACGGDGPTANSGDALTEPEVQEIAVELFAELGGLFSGGFGTTSEQHELPFGLSLSQAAVPISESFDETFPCEGGGTVTLEGEISGNVDDETFEGDLDIDLTEDLHACVVEGQNITATVNGEPNIRLRGTFVIESESISAEFTYVGGFSFVTDDGRSGTCGIDISSTLTISGAGTGSLATTTTGTLCGITVDNEFLYGET